MTEIEELVLEGIPFPPSNNGLYATSRQGRRFPSQAHKSYTAQWHLYARVHKDGIMASSAVVKTWLALGFGLQVHCTFYSPAWVTKKHKTAKMDVQNRDKILIDSLFGSIGVDDSEIITCTYQKSLSQLEQVKVIIRPCLMQSFELADEMIHNVREI